jgi:hypothetical protein
MPSLISGYIYDIFISYSLNMEAKYQAEHDRVEKWLEETGQL